MGRSLKFLPFLSRMSPMTKMNIDEKGWQEFWEREGVFETENTSSKPKFYCLDMFPYPSGEGLHVGHPRGYVATDVLSHFKRMQGYNVLHPMGWDAFGLPAENHAIKTGTHPKDAIEKNIERSKEQLNKMGLSYDWKREINTTDPEYFKWTQWIFLQMFKEGLAYEDTLPINWCPSCKTGLANEEVVGGLCERCDAQVEKKDVRQWVLRITDYADRLLDDLEELEWPESIKEMQKNWIGRSEGTVIKFETTRKDEEEIEVFTTRADTLFGATFLVLAPEHSLIEEALKGEEVENPEEVRGYVENARKRSDLERTDLSQEKTGVEIRGLKAVNPLSGEEVPIWVADYVLGSYGKGGIMSVPAHDERDHEMARKYDLEVREVVRGGEIPHEGEGELVNSGEFSGLSSEEAREKITEELEAKEKGRRAVNYKLRDWIFSRQRYWGEPMPIVFCEECNERVKRYRSEVMDYRSAWSSTFNVEGFQYTLGEISNPGWISIKEEDLPLTLPEVEKYQPTGTGESPLALEEKWLSTECPRCGAEAKRETNTMPQWAGSCWYYLAYIMKGESPSLEFPVSRYEEKFKEWLPVDLYVGGAEHAVLHLLYARFWHKFLYDLGVVPTKEPFLRLKNQGLIMGEGGIKMSKSKGNIISPDDVIEKHGADVLRLYEMFLGGFEDDVAWSEEGVNGMRRFLERVEKLVEKVKEAPASRETEASLHKTIKKVTGDIEEFKFNTAISSLMSFCNELKDLDRVPQRTLEDTLKLLSPFAPHFCEEMWSKLGNEPSILRTEWPRFSEEKTKEELATVVVQVNGKVRSQIEVNTGAKKELVEDIAKEMVEKWLEEKEIKKVVFVEDKLINFVTE